MKTAGYIEYIYINKYSITDNKQVNLTEWLKNMSGSCVKNINILF